MGRELVNLTEDASDARTRLNVFYGVIALLEDTMPGGCNKADRAAQSIIQQCKKAAGVQLDKYDAAIRAIGALSEKSS